MSICRNCPRNCNIERSSSRGVCGVGDEIRVARAAKHFGEEPCISGNKGSGTIFFSGCSLKCVMCQNFEISHDHYGKDVSEDEFIKIVCGLENQSVHNINLVTPTHYFKQLESAFSKYRPKVPIVYNSSGYENEENIKKNIYDIYLFDLKFFSSEKSARYSSCADYFEYASKTIKAALKIKGKPIYDKDGIMQSGVIIRHLILPRSTNDSIHILNWIKENASDAVLSLMSQYVPMYRSCEYPEINRRLTSREYNKVLEHCCTLGLENVYIQSPTSSSKDMIPKFDLTGLH